MEGGAGAGGSGAGAPASTAVGTPAGAARWRTPRFDAALAFLREELAASPERYRATARIIISCAIATVLVASLHVPDGAWVVITIFIVSMPNAGATLQKGLQRLAGTLVACGTGMVLIAAFVDVPWLRVPIGGLAAGLAIFLFRTTTVAYAAILGGITFALFFLNPAEQIEAVAGFGLWRTLLVLTGVLIVLLVDLLILPTDPEAQLLRDLERRLAAVESLLARVVGAVSARHGREADELRTLVMGGLGGEIAMLADAEARHRFLRFRHPEQIVLITAVERLATGALGLQRAVDSAGADPATGPLAGRLRAIHEGVGVMGRCIRGRHVPHIWTAPPDSGVAGDAPALGAHQALLPAVFEMEEALRQGARALGFLGGAGSPVLAPAAELRSVLDAPPSGLLTPSFSLGNLADVQIALKASLAEVLLYLFMTGTNWPGIQTGLVTVLVIAGASNGAMIHKAMLRCAGAVLGGLIGLVAIVAAMPFLTSIAGFLPVAVACFAIAAWVTAGGPRTCYAGVQTGIALALVLTNALGPTIDLTVARDRVVGILIGDMLTTLVFYALWPVFATRGMRRALAATVHSIADLSRVGARLIAEDLVRPARGFRWQVYQNFATTLSMHDEAAYEANAGTAEIVAARAGVRQLLPLVQEVFLATLSVARHRQDVSLIAAPAPIVDALRSYSAALAVRLDAIADRLSGLPERESPSLPALLETASATLAAYRTASATSPEVRALVVHAEGRVELQRELLALIERLDLKARAVAPLLIVVDT